MSLNEDITEMPKSVTSQEAIPKVTPTPAQGAIKKSGATKKLAAPALDQAPPQLEIAANPAPSRQSRKENINEEMRRKKEEEEEMRATDALMHELTLLMTKLSTELPSTVLETTKRDILTTMLEEVVVMTSESLSVADEMACASHSGGTRKKRSAKNKKNTAKSSKAGVSLEEAERRILEILEEAKSGSTVRKPRPLVQGPPNECDLLTNKDPHFMSYIREYKMKSLEDLLEAAKSLIEFSTSAILRRRQ